MYIWVANISYTMSLGPRRWWRKRSSRRVLPWTGRAPRWPTDGLFEWRWVKQYWLVEVKDADEHGGKPTFPGMNMGISRDFVMIFWLVVWNIFFHRLGRIIPTDNLIFFRGVGIPPTRIINHPYWNSLYHIKMVIFGDCLWLFYPHQKAIKMTSSWPWWFFRMNLVW